MRTSKCRTAMSGIMRNRPLRLFRAQSGTATTRRSMKSCIFLLIFLIFHMFCIGTALSRKQFNIGVIFDDDFEQHELAFRAAVDRVNIHERSFQLVPIVKRTTSGDSFTLEKIVCGLIAENVIAIFGPSSSKTTGIVSSICDTLEIPHILFGWKPTDSILNRQFTTMTLNVHPDDLVMSRALADIVQDFSWRSYTIIYESDREIIQLQDVLHIHEPDNNPTTVRQLPSGPDFRPFLKSIKTSGEACLILNCATENILPILQQANELKMLGEYQSLFITSFDTHTLDLNEIFQVGANITTIRIVDPTDFDVKNAVHDWEERERRDGRYFKALPETVQTSMLLITDAVWVFAKGVSELGIVEDMDPPSVTCKRNRAWPFGRRIIEYIKAKPQSSTTGQIEFNQFGQRTHVQMRVLEMTPTGFIETATWDPVHGVEEIKIDDSLNKQRVELKIANKTFIVTSRIGAPFLLNRPPKDGEILEGNARYEGYSMDLIDSIAKLLGFKYLFELAPDGKYGGYNKVTKQWDGLVRQLIDGNADLGVCDLTMTSARRKAVDFTPPFMTLGISILYAKPETPPPNLFSFLSPFSLDVWIYMATAYLGVALMLFALSRMAPDDWENPHPCKEPEELENLWTISNTTWLAIGSIMGQGCDILPKAASTRLVTGMWWFFALMMLNSYTANLAAFLTMSRMENTISDAEELAAQSKIKYGAVTGGSTMGFFRDSNFSTYQRMWSAMESARPSVFTKSNDEGVERVLKGKMMYAFLMESTSLEYIIERNCELSQVGGWLDYKSYGIAMPFNSPYRKQISEAVLKLGESGALSELKRKWWKEKHGGGRCAQASQKADVDSSELGIGEVGGVFLVLCFGLIVAYVLGIIEFLWNIKTVAIEEKVSLGQAFKGECLFVLKFWIQTKPVHTSSSSSNTSSSSSSSSSSSKSSSSKSKSDSMSGNVHERLKKIGSMFSLKSGKKESDSKSVEGVDKEKERA